MSNLTNVIRTQLKQIDQLRKVIEIKNKIIGLLEHRAKVLNKALEYEVREWCRATNVKMNQTAVNNRKYIIINRIEQGIERKYK